MQKLFGEDTLVVNNYDWFKDYNYIDFLRDVGKYVNVSYMINKDLVKRQMDIGISYAEFSYMLIQGYDLNIFMTIMELIYSLVDLINGVI